MQFRLLLITCFDIQRECQYYRHRAFLYTLDRCTRPGVGVYNNITAYIQVVFESPV